MQHSEEKQSVIPLVELTRGLPNASLTKGLTESFHCGALAVVDDQGRLLAAAGDPGAMAFMRSAAKPFQALPTVAAGALEHFGLDDEALAIMCASHHGTAEHVAVVQRILDALSLDETALQCGIHWPANEDAARRLAAAGLQPDPRHNNCSGKHAGMLALARLRNLPANGYTNLDHPVQQSILHRLASLADLGPEQITCGADGCTVPTFALPLANAALAYARLISPSAAPECRRVVAAMQAYPHLVADHGALDDLLMRAGQGTIVSKGGAEGYQGLGIRTPDGRSIGIALKIADGNPRGKGPVIIALLEALALASRRTLEHLEALRRPLITNHRKQVVGEMRAVFELTRFG